MAKRRIDPCLRNARKGERIFSSVIGTRLKMAANSDRKSSSSICLTFFMFIISLTICLSCISNNEKDIARKNIEEYLHKNTQEGAELKFEKFSDLYIIDPKDESNMPMAEDAKDFAQEFNLRAAGFYLAVNGCTPKILDLIISNDKKFKEWKTGGKEFVMICFFSGKDKYLNEIKGGLCFRLDSTLNVYKPYKLVKQQEIYDMINKK